MISLATLVSAGAGARHLLQMKFGTLIQCKNPVSRLNLLGLSWSLAQTHGSENCAGCLLSRE